MKKQRARLDLEKATLEADLRALELEKAAAAAKAEANVLEAAAEKECENVHSLRSSLAPQERQEQMKTYVDQQAEVSFNIIAPSLNASQPLSIKVPLSGQASPVLSPIFFNDAQTVYSATQPSAYLFASEHHPCLPQHTNSYPRSPYKVSQQ